MNTTRHDPDDIVPEEAMRKISLAWAQDLLAIADMYGEAPIPTAPFGDGTILVTQNLAIGMRAYWDISDDQDLTIATHWLHCPGRTHEAIAVQSAESLSDLASPYIAAMTIDDLSHELPAAAGPRHAQSLIDAGADISARYSPLGITALHICAWRPHGPNPELLNRISPVELANVLIASGMDVNTRTDMGKAPLHSCDQPDVAKILIVHGADVNARDDFGRTPLHDAINPDVAEILIASGADPLAVNTSGISVRDSASGVASALQWDGSQEDFVRANEVFRVIDAAATKALLERNVTRQNGGAEDGRRSDRHRARRM